MNTQKKIQHSLNDLVEVSRDGAKFYADAAGEVESTELSALFRQMAGHKQDIVNGLTADIAAAGGEAAEHGTMVGSMREAYGKVRAALGDKDYAYVAELEALEDRSLKAFREIVSDNDTPAQARAFAEKYLPRASQCHDIMRARKHAMQSAR